MSSPPLFVLPRLRSAFHRRHGVRMSKKFEIRGTYTVDPKTGVVISISKNTTPQTHQAQSLKLQGKT